MSIRRGSVAADQHFTITPNAWVRDARLSFRARGLLTYLLSHREGWQVSERSLVEQSQEGRYAIRTALAELEEVGYLMREQKRDERGRMTGTDHVLTDPECADKPWSGSPTAGSPTAGDSLTKKNISQKTIEKKTMKTPPHPPAADDQAAAPAAPTDSEPDDFTRWYDAYGHKHGRAAAQRAYVKARKSATAQQLLDAIPAYLASKRVRDGYVKDPATWLNGGHWDDVHEPYVNPKDAAWQRNLDRIAELQAEEAGHDRPLAITDDPWRT